MPSGKYSIHSLSYTRNRTWPLQNNANSPPYRSIGQAATIKFNCSDLSYQLSFPNGLYNVEDFLIEISRADGSESGKARAYGNSWKCEKHDGYPSETCAWDGVFHVGLSQ
jgi:hypothetical protein